MASQGLVTLDKLTGVCDHKKMTKFHFLEANGKWSPSKKTRVQALHNHQGNSLASIKII